MSRSVGAALPQELRELLAQTNLPLRLGRVLPLITVDADGRPHPMLLSYLEVLAPDARTLRVAIGARGRSAANLAERRVATLLVIEPGLAVYVKGRVTAGPRAVGEGELARFDLAVEDVLVDSAAEWEEGLQITAGIAYGPVQSLESPWALATLAALREPAG